MEKESLAVQICQHCGHENIAKSLYCGLCGESLTGRHMADNGPTPLFAGPSFRPPVELKNELRLAAAKARRFLIMLVGLLSPPVALLITGWSRQANPLAGMQQSPLYPVLIGGAAVWCATVYGYMIAKTGESNGAPFFRTFVQACLPPLTPGVWSRLGGHAVWRPYAWLLVDALILGVGGWFLAGWPYLLLLLTLCMLPLVIYHCFGGVIGTMAGALGLSAPLTLLWLCLLPDLLLLLMVWEFLGALDPSMAQQPLALTIAEIALFLNPEHLMTYTFFKTLTFVYGLVSFAAWVKVVYENLKLPLD